MRGTIRALAFAIALATTPACGVTQRQAEAAAANTVTASFEYVLDELLAMYETDGRKAIESAQSEAEARELLETVDLKWFPVWTAWEMLAAAQRSWVRGGFAPEQAAAVLTAWCDALSLYDQMDLPRTAGMRAVGLVCP